MANHQLQYDSQEMQPSDRKQLCVAYILSYRDPNYVRSLSLLKALENCPGVRVVLAKNTSNGLWRYVETWRALRRIRTSETPDIYILGFRGHEAFWPVRWMTRGVPLVFDAMMSPYASLQDERKTGLAWQLLSPLFYQAERRLLQRADLVLTDTRLHAEYYTRTFAIPDTEICAVPVGATEPKLNKSASRTCDADPFNVLFYGSFLPLHGVDVIVMAAALLADLPIQFDFIGGTIKQASRLHRQCKQLNVNHYTHRRWVPFEQLLRTDLPQASVCLGGPFGGTPQARRVVTGKTSQCLAMGKVTIIGNIDENYGFADRINCLLVDQADPHALATAIRWTYENRSRLNEIGIQGRELYDGKLSIRVIGRRLLPALQRVTATKIGIKRP